MKISELIKILKKNGCYKVRRVEIMTFGIAPIPIDYFKSHDIRVRNPVQV